MEAIYYGVPMVGMPIFIDQGDALIKLKEKGIALGFDKDTATADEIYNALHEVLHNPEFKQNIQKLSLLMKDVQEPPLNRVMNFMEYLIRHKGAEHLKLSSRHLNFVQYFCLDTLAFLSLIFLCLSYIQFLVLKAVCRRIFSIGNVLISRISSSKRSNSSISNLCPSTQGTSGNTTHTPSLSNKNNTNNNLISGTQTKHSSSAATNRTGRTVNGSYVKEVVNRIQKGVNLNLTKIDNSTFIESYVPDYSNHETKKRL
jgi:hypothetical protein